jgi:hypothetical protein
MVSAHTREVNRRVVPEGAEMKVTTAGTSAAASAPLQLTSPVVKRLRV